MSIWQIDMVFTVTMNLGKSRPGDNCKEEVIEHFLTHQNWAWPIDAI